MLSMIKDRIDNKERYEKERFSKYGKHINRRKWHCDINTETKKREYRDGMKYAPAKRLIIDGCNHEDKEEIRKALPKIYHYDDHYGYGDWIIPEAAMHVKDYEAILQQKEQQQTDGNESKNHNGANVNDDDDDDDGQPPIMTCGKCNEKIRLHPKCWSTIRNNAYA